MQPTTSAEASNAPPPAEMMANFAQTGNTQARLAPRRTEIAHPPPNPPVLTQQAIFAQNSSDPNALLHLLHQLGVANNWGPSSSQQAANLNLDQLLAQIARQPEIASSIPGLLSNMPGMNGQQAKPQEPNTPASEPGPSSYTQQLYGNGATGLGDGDMKDDDDLPGGLDDDPKASSVKCAKEKNRQAQRRFRERQKGLIQQLKDKNDAFAKQVEDQRQQIKALEKEAHIMRVLLQEKTKT